MNSAPRFTDVTLRDGLQAESQIVSVEQKLKLFDLLSQCGFSRLEITSFVHPKWVPQLADSEEFCQRLFAKKNVQETMVFIPNEKGLERALKYPIPWLSAFVAASETFNQKNINAGIEETLVTLEKLVKVGHLNQKKIRIYLSVAFGCPYEGEISEGAVGKYIERIGKIGADEMALSDTIGVASPDRVRRLCEKAFGVFPRSAVALHLHDTYGMALANASAGYQAGVTQFDGSVGGIGGCPYAKGATGNAAIESLQYLFARESHYPFSWAAIQKVHAHLKSLQLKIHSPLYSVVERGGEPYGI